MLDDAIREYNRAARLRPDYAKAHFNLALALTNKGLHDHAKSELTIVGSIRHRQALEHYNRGVDLAGRDEAYNRWPSSARRSGSTRASTRRTTTSAQCSPITGMLDRAGGPSTSWASYQSG